MMTEERTRFEVLLESIETKVNVIAESHGALVERLDRMERRFEIRFDVLESRFIGLETKVDGLEVFANDAQSRLKRIETHLQLKRASGSAPRHIATSAAPSKRRRKP